MKPDFRYPQPDPEHSFRVFYKTQDQQNAPLHYHPDYEMNFVIKGNGKRIVGSNIENFEAGDLILMAPNLPHRWKNSNNFHGAYSSLVIQWKEDFLGKAWESVPEFKPIRNLFDLSNKGIKFDHYIANEIKKNQIELLKLPPFKKLMLFLQLLNDLAKASEFRTLSEDQLSFTDIPNSRINKLFAFVKDSYSEKITLSRISGLVNMSEGAFSRFFSQAMGKPFFSFLNEYRINMACKMLRESDLQASEIGYSCGYDCLQFFYRQFAKYIHCSPQEYRKHLL
ncbi:MAG: AraC family transcriptional regulator [Chitinophagaceae bacterium]